MNDVAPNTPVIIGVGFVQEKSEDPLACPEASQLMLNAIRNAAADASTDASTGSDVAKTLLKQLESISVQKGSWQYSNPGKILAEELGCPEAKSILADLGVLQITPLFNLCQAIADGEQHIGVVTGGEARFRALRSMITQQPVSDTEQAEDTPPPDVFHETPDPFWSDMDTERGLWSPGEFYAIAESAIRYHQGLSIEENRDKIASLYSGFSEVAAANPHAWQSDSKSVDEIRNPSKSNAMIAFPYTKSLMSQWNVNQAVAIIVCSAAKAQELGLDSSGWIYPQSSAQSRHVVLLSQKKTLHSHPGAVVAGERALAMADVSPEDLSAVDLYSCFPSAIQSFAADLQLKDVSAVSVTGSMAFAGGPFNHGGVDSVARMVEVLRSTAEEAGPDKKLTGLVTNISGMFGKQACALFSNRPNTLGYGFEDVTETVAERDVAIPLDDNYQGQATIVGYTVAFNKGDISHAVAFCDTAEGERTVVRSDDKKLAHLMTQEEFCGRAITVLSGGIFEL